MEVDIERSSEVRLVTDEPSLMLLAGRALVLQLALPAVAHGVRDHSDFKRQPFKRLEGTLEAMYAIVHGSPELADRVGRRIHWIHEQVTGPGYRANTAENLMWVHATLVDTALMAYRLFVGSLTAEQEESFYAGMKRVVEPLGLPADSQPRDLGEFRDYFEGTLDSLVVTEAGRELIRFVASPRLAYRLDVPFYPAIAAQRVFTVGATPASVRDQVGWRWNTARQRQFDRLQSLIRLGTQLQPRPLRTAPSLITANLMVRNAERHVLEFESAHGTHEIGSLPAA